MSLATYDVPDLYEARYSTAIEALCRAIEQHEAFRQEVSDALEKRGFYIDDRDLGGFILPKPVDPLVEAMNEVFAKTKSHPITEGFSKEVRAALAARGLEITQKKEQN